MPTGCRCRPPVPIGAAAILCVIPEPASRNVIAIRGATSGDARAIGDLLSAAFAEFEPHYTPAGYAATILTPAVIRGRIERQETLVAVVADSIVGTVSIEQRGDATHVRSMAVLPSARGHRIARALLTEVEARARERGCPCLELITASFLRAAVGLYESCGFREDLTGPHDLYGTSVIPLKKELTSLR